MLHPLEAIAVVGLATFGGVMLAIGGFAVGQLLKSKGKRMGVFERMAKHRKPKFSLAQGLIPLPSDVDWHPIAPHYTKEQFDQAAWKLIMRYPSMSESHARTVLQTAIELLSGEVDQ